MTDWSWWSFAVGVLIGLLPVGVGFLYWLRDEGYDHLCRWMKE